MIKLIEEKVAPDFKERLVTRFSNQVVAELSVLEIENIEAEILNMRQDNHTPPDLIMCTGDRVTDFNTENEVLQFIRDCARVLCAGGKLFLSYRDLFKEVGDEQRFIPIHLNHDRLLTAVLEYFPGFVKVSELLYEKSVSGDWVQKVKSYHKLRLSEGFIMDAFMIAGLEIHLFTNENGVISVLGVKL